MSETLSDILNWRSYSPLISASGQPSEAQLAALAQAGVEQIINLGPHDNKGALRDEAGTVSALGLGYTYIPVDFAAPTQADFDAFRAALDTHSGARLHVHCIYNARVSAFFYRLSKTSDLIDETEAARIMDNIWRPGADWADFIDAQEAKGQPNRYAGYEYEA